MSSFHSSPNDYYRWSKQGLKELLKDFKEVDCGVRGGPTSALRQIVSEWLATVLSFGFAGLQQALFVFFTIISFPMNIFDLLISKFSSSEKIACAFYFIGKK